MGSNGQAAAAVEQQQDWEDCKENYQPLKSGRKPGALKENLLSEKKVSIEEQRRFHIEAIRSYKGDDPLEAWLSYIKWNAETFKSGGHKAELLPLLERCTRELQACERYRKDIRYLRVWIQYADCLPDPTDVFSFLKDHDIGQEHALFYLAHAMFLEQRKSYAAADNTYQQGINRVTVPADLSRLQAKYKEFESRMARRIQRKSQEQTAENDTVGHPERPSLAVLGGRSNRRPVGLTQKRKAIATPGKANAPAGGLSIFVDEEFGGPSASVPYPPGSGAPASAAGPSWTSLPSFDQARKENTQKAASWAGQRIKQKSIAAIPAAPALEIPLDPDFEVLEQGNAMRHASGGPQITLRQRLDSGGINEQLAHDPLRLHKGEPSHNLPTNLKHEAFGAPLREHVLACNESALTDESANEVSFEELRAVKWLAARHIPTDPKGITHDEIPVASSAPTPFDQSASEPAQQSAAASEVTMTTRGAFDAVNVMFGGRFGLSSSEDAAVLDPTMTIATKDAFAAINSMFKQSFTGTETSSLDRTMSMQAAYEALNAVLANSGQATTAANDDAPCLHPAGSAQPTSQILIRTDTSLISEGVQDDANAEVNEVMGVGLDIREDTVFFSGGAERCGVDALSIREDTVFINHRGADEKEASEGLDVREDTVFITKGPYFNACQEGPPGLDIREDTIFIAGVPDSSDRATMEDTAPLMGGGAVGSAVDRWGFVPGEDDTLQLDAEQPVREHSTGVTADLCGLDLAAATVLHEAVDSPENNENHDPDTSEPAPANAMRDVRISAVAAGVLKPLAPGQYDHRGIVLEEDEEAEATMQTAPSQTCAIYDEFEVFTGDEQQVEIGPAELVNPFSGIFQQHMLAMLDPPVSQWPGVITLSDRDEEKTALAAFKRSRSSGFSSISFADVAFKVFEKIGAGAYATVYEAEDTEGNVCALKVESPPCPWEWYMCKVVSGRIPSASRPFFVDPTALFLGNTASVLQMPCGRLGSLQDLLNVYLARGTCPDETIAARIAALLMRLVGDLHAARVLHNDMKPDNLLVSLEAPSAENDENAVPVLGLQIIDFGRSLDLELLAPAAALTGDSGTDSFRCTEMREGRPWLWHADAYGVAGILHCLLFGEYMDVERAIETSGGRAIVRIKSKLRRYWQEDLWTSTFHALLNHATLDSSSPPAWAELGAQFEYWLSSSRDVARKERAELNKLAALLPQVGKAQK